MDKITIMVVDDSPFASKQMDVIFDTEIGTMQVELHYSGVE